MTRLKLIALLCTAYCLLNAAESQAAYYLNDTRSTDGMYAYENAPAASPGGGDEGQGKIFTFADGALMDGNGSNFGQNITFPHSPRSNQMKRVYLDLGQEVVLKSLAVKSHLDAWWTIGPFYIELAGQDGKFYYKARHVGAGLPIPHDPGLSSVCQLNVTNKLARYLKLTFIVPMWNHTRIDELDIKAALPANAKPIGKIDLAAFRTWFDGHTRLPLVDEFGQWVHEDWPGKIHGEADLAKRMNEEVARYAKVERDLVNFDRFGGNKALGFTSKATGAWRLEKIGKRWWFITPEGNPFILIGMDGVNCWGVNTVGHPDRPELPGLFAWLPPKDGKFAGGWVFSLPEKKIWRFDFFRANVMRCFGEGKDSDNKLYDLIQRRLLDWGFNTLGKWSEVNPTLEAMGRPMPYILPIGATPLPGITLHTVNGLEDPWDPNYLPAVEAAIKTVRDTRGKDPYLIGIAFYGENWWGATATATMLKGPADSPAKRAFCQLLLENHGASLNGVKKWLGGASWKTIDDMYAADLTPYSLPLKKDIASFIERASNRYFGAWRKAINQHDPGRLLLGACFVPTWLATCSPEWIRGSASYCDAMMLDDYGIEPTSVLQNYVAKFAVPADKPVILGEYSVTTCERGFDAFGSDVITQADRGKAYRQLNAAYFAHPNWVGSMWFLYRDEVLLGRDEDGYGECHNFGLVDVCNLPYYDMIAIMKAANAKLFKLHAGQDAPERWRSAR